MKPEDDSTGFKVDLKIKADNKLVKFYLKFITFAFVFFVIISGGIILTFFFKELFKFILN